MPGTGPELALALLAGFRNMTDAAIAELARRGFEDVRPVHEFAMSAIVAGADSASELGRRLSVTKQSAARTIAVLQEHGYVSREPDPDDARRKRLVVTPLGHEVLRTGEQIFDEVRERWRRTLGAEQFDRFEADLVRLVGTQRARFDTAAWINRGTDQPQNGELSPVLSQNASIGR